MSDFDDARKRLAEAHRDSGTGYCYECDSPRPCYADRVLSGVDRLTTENACIDCREYRATLAAELAAERKRAERLEKALRESLELLRDPRFIQRGPHVCQTILASIRLSREALHPAAPDLTGTTAGKP